jgi:hypothetical protein
MATELGVACEAAPVPRELSRHGAAFVTLRLAGELRGCVGTVEPWRALADDVRGNAVAAAFHDPRFAPLRRDELHRVSIEVSVLGASEPVRACGEDAVLAALRPGTDGVVIACGRHRATFLPQVWEALPAPADFMAALKDKAGLPRDFWSADLRVSRYAVDKFAEADA